MMRSIVRNLFFFILSAPILSSAQDKAPDCNALKNGVFHAYSKNEPVHYIIYRDGEVEKEVNLTKKDSTVWKVEWKNDCNYTLKYISGNAPISDETASVLKKHKLAYRIERVTKEYYTYSEYIDKPSGVLIETDTVWNTEKSNYSASPLFLQLEDNSALRKAHFSDTSKYAVLYIYRPGKLKLSLSSYLVYFENNLLCVLKNKSGFIFILPKEGLFTIKSKLDKDESPLTLDVKFGKRYYVRSVLNWGMYSGLRNSKLAMELIDAKEGKDEFESIQ